jgi:hypothetical protein
MDTRTLMDARTLMDDFRTLVGCKPVAGRTFLDD